MTSILITGANKGLGFEAARQLVSAGHHVFLGSRDAERGRAAAEQIGAQAVQLDVTDDDSVNAAVATIEAAGGLDVLINNAGIAPDFDPDAGLIGAADLTADLMARTFETNVFGTVRVLHAFLPLLTRSDRAMVVNVSSGLSSLTDLTDPDSHRYRYPGVAYPASKTALNVLTIQYAKAFPRIRINSVEPGFTQTDLNGQSGTQSVADGARVIVAMAQLSPDGPTGGLFDVNGPMPW